MTDPAWLETVIARATLGDTPRDARATARRMLARWQRAVGGRTALRRRLRWSACRSMRDWLTAPVVGDPSVDWATGLRELVQHLAANPNPSATDLDALLHPLGESAATQVLRRLRAGGLEVEPLLDQPAKTELAQSLVRRVSKPLRHAWEAWLAEHPLTRLAGEEPALAPLHAELAASALRALFERFPVAARLAGTVYRLELDAQEELLARLTHDLPALRETWSLQLPLRAPPVRALRLHLADPHRGGRAVACVAFADGTRLAYKPHPLHLEAAIEAWWRQAEPVRPQLRYLTRDAYGWMEWIEASPPADPAANVRLHRRIGALLARSLEFGLCDLHRGNVLLAGEHPLVVDAECLRPDLPLGDPPAAPRSDDPVERLLGSGILPRWRRRPRDAQLETRTLLDASLGEPETQAVIEGFLATAPSTHPPERLAALAAARARFLTRPTTSYSLVQRRLLRPDALEDIRLFDALVDTLARGWADAPDRPAEWPLVEAERRALYRLDIPAFDYLPAHRHLQACDGTRLANAFPAAPASRWPAHSPDASRLERARDAARCASLLRRALGPTPPPPCITDSDPVATIAQHLLDAALPAADGAPTWLGYDCDPADLSTRPALSDHGVYQGRAGIALFLLAAAARCPRAGATAAQVFDALAAAPTPGAPLGWAHGLAGASLALHAAGEFAHCDHWRGAAARGAEEIARRAIALRASSINDWPRFDVFSGIAGAALALAPHAALLDAACALVALIQLWLDRNPPPAIGLMHGASGLAVAAGRVAAACAQTNRAADAALAWHTALSAVRWENRLVDPSTGLWQPQSGFDASWCHHTAGIALARATLLECAQTIGDRAASDTAALRNDLARATLDVTHAAPAALDLLCCGQLGRLACLLLASEDSLSHAPRHLDAWKSRVAELGWKLDATPPHAWLPPGLCRGLAGPGWVLLAAEDARARQLLHATLLFSSSRKKS